jgi:hypothetical protein
LQLPGQPAREKNSDEDRCDDRKRMTVGCHYDDEQDRERGNKNHKAERAGHRFDLRCVTLLDQAAVPCGASSMSALSQKRTSGKLLAELALRYTPYDEKSNSEDGYDLIRAGTTGF